MAQYKAKRGGSSGRTKAGPGGRTEAVRVRSARGRKLSSTTGHLLDNLWFVNILVLKLIVRLY